MDVDRDQDHDDMPPRQQPAKRSAYENEQVADHYNSRGNQSFKLRRLSPIIEVRKVNNFIKSVLILEFCHKGDFVLDIGGGKGGDLNKWHKAKIDHLVLADVAENSIKDAMARYNDTFKKGKSSQFRFSSSWLAIDCCLPEMGEELDHVDFFDVVSCQFAMHYAFETEERTKQFLENVARKLRPGGYFIGTTPDAHVLLERALASDDMKSFGNSQYSVTFDQECQNITNGQRYVFSLEDAVTNVPEYIVDPQVLVNLCDQLDLELIRLENLQALYNQSVSSKRFRHLADDQHLPAHSDALQADTWDTVGLYLSFVFRKRGTPQTTRHRLQFPLHPYQNNDIITLTNPGSARRASSSSSHS